MSQATVTYHDTVCCAVRCDIALKDGVKALAGATFDGDSKAWLVPVMHLPTLKAMFDSMTVAPDVIAAYQTLLKKLLCHALADRSGLLASTLQRHEIGIAHVLATGWRPTPVALPHYTPVSVAVEEPAPQAADAGLVLLMRGVRGAVKAEERKAAMLPRRHRA